MNNHKKILTALAVFFTLFFPPQAKVDDFDLFYKFDQQDEKNLNQLLDKAERCIKNWNFSCAENALSKAEKYITSKKDKQKINRMYSYLEEERERKEKERSRYATSSGSSSVSFKIEKGYQDNEYRAKFSDGRTGYIYLHLKSYSGGNYYDISVWGDGLRDPVCNYFPNNKKLYCPNCVDTYVNSFGEALYKVVQCAIN